MKKLIILMPIFALVMFDASAAEVTELYVEPSVCLLKEEGALTKSDPISIQGKKTEHGCLAFIADDVFEKRFKFCVYSGFEMAGGEEAAYYSCTYSREENSYMFRAYMSYEGLARKPDLICYFMCYNK